MERRLPYSPRAATSYKSLFARTESAQYQDFYLRDTLWQDVISKYTATVLTYESDKWLAISGLARRYMEKTGRRLVAGLHLDFILEELAWWSDRPVGRLSNGAPTWSWLSCKSKVEIFAVKSNEVLATLVALPDEQMVDCTWHTIYSSVSPTGETPQADRYPITISGHVRPFCYVAQEGRSNESFDARYHTYSLEAETKRVWLDIPLKD
ncbi:MAG: hypothetical protein Q9224_007388, partial [Gallowayella concinna]